MSAHLASPPGKGRAGVTYVLVGRENWPNEIDLSTPPNDLISINGETPADLLATSLGVLAAGDGESLIVGVSLGDVAGRSDAGSVHVLNRADLAPASTISVSQAGGVSHIGAESGTGWARTWERGTWTETARGELVVIAESAAGPDGARPRVGRVYVLSSVRE